MTHEELQAIKAPAEAATPGSDGAAQLVRFRQAAENAEAQGHIRSAALFREAYDFIAHARTDVPALVAEVERLRGILDGVAQKLLGTELDALVRRGHDFLPDAVESLRAHRDSLVSRMRMK